jgi:hypothetical protein
MPSLGATVVELPGIVDEKNEKTDAVEHEDCLWY